MNWTTDKPKQDGWYWVKGCGRRWCEKTKGLVPSDEHGPSIVLVKNGKIIGSSWPFSTSGTDFFCGPIDEPQQP